MAGWIVAFLFTRIISLSSIICAITLPLFIIFWYRGDYARLMFGVVAALLVIYKHRSNIQRILAGIEPKTTLFHRKQPDAAETSTQNPESTEDVSLTDK